MSRPLAHGSVLILLSPLLAGCLFLPPRAGLARIQSARPAKPDFVTVFIAQPAPGEHGLDELRETLDYWSGEGSGGRPRWEGVLAPSPPDLYQHLLQAIDAGASAITLKAYKYDVVGLDPVTLVDYLDAEGKLIGWDHVVFAELAPRKRKYNFIIGYFDLAWWEIPQMLVLDLPVYLAIGLKELAGEVVKTPVSFVSSAWTGPPIQGWNPLSPVVLERGFLAIAEDLKNGWTAFTWRFRVRSRHTPFDLVRDLAAAVPVVGPAFGPRSPPADAAGLPATSVIAVSQGLNAGGDAEQYTTAWKRAIEEARSGMVVIEAPYRYGGIGDTFWSLLNLSHGMGYDLAERIAFDEGIGRGDGVDLLGFSGGAQRAVAASQALRLGGITVVRLAGIAGPMGGNSCAWQSALLLAAEPLADPVVVAARFHSALEPFPTNAGVSSVPEGGGHRVPYFPDGATRAPALGYARRLEEFLGAE
jgi:hypothetical protein